MLTQNGRISDFGVRRTRSDRDRTVAKLDLPREKSCDVYEAGWEMQPEFHVPQQRLAASEQHRAIFAGKHPRFVERPRTTIEEVTHGRLHGFGSAWPWRQRQWPRRCCDTRCSDRCCL